MNHPSNRVTVENIGELFTYHAPTGDQVTRMGAVSKALQTAAEAIMAAVPDCADRTHAIRQLRDVRMWANAAIALEPREGPQKEFAYDSSNPLEPKR